MSRRIDPCRKRPQDILADLLEGHAEAVREGPQAARKYLEKVVDQNKSLPNACKFFVYDLLADACYKCTQLGRDEHAERCAEAVQLARKHMADAREDAPRELQAYLPGIRAYEVGIAAAVDEGRYEDALALCHEAVELGLGRVYEAKARSIERML